MMLGIPRFWLQTALMLRAILPLDAGPLPASESTTEFIGQIQTYNPGKLLTVRIYQRRELRFDLTDKHTVYQISPGLQKGNTVRVKEQHLSDGRQEVIVRPKGHGK